MASDLKEALKRSRLERSVIVGEWRVIRNGFWDDPPNTYRLYRRSGAGWHRVLTVVVGSRKEADLSGAGPEDLEAVRQALAFWGIPGEVRVQDGKLALSGG
ncbi:MAG: hypothetical protein L6E13_06350 [Firmicutes bacterium]|nr:hypothetical protein [Bacillota bacterium]